MGEGIPWIGGFTGRGGRGDCAPGCPEPVALVLFPFLEILTETLDPCPGFVITPPSLEEVVFPVDCLLCALASAFAIAFPSDFASAVASAFASTFVGDAIARSSSDSAAATEAWFFGTCRGRLHERCGQLSSHASNSRVSWSSRPAFAL